MFDQSSFRLIIGFLSILIIGFLLFIATGFAHTYIN